MSYNYLPLDRKWLNFQQVKNLLDYNQLVSITFDAHERILKCTEYLDRISITNDEAVQPLDQSQANLLKNFAVGFGEEVPADIVKLMLMLKIKSISYGHSAVQIETVKRLMEMYNNGVFPVMYSRGATGPYGDSIALSHLALPLVGLGEVNYEGQKRSSASVLQELNWQPLNLQSNEAIALVSGTQFTSAYALYALKQAEQLLKFADIIAALSFTAFNCSVQPLHEKIHSVRGHKGQIDTATAIWNYLQGSAVVTQNTQGFPDPYSFTCIPQVHGATKDTFHYVFNIFLTEINSVTTGVNIFPVEEVVLNGGNFNQQPLSLAVHFLCIAMGGLADISEKRICQLMSGQRGLPLFLGKNDEPASGLKILQYTAAGINSENKQLCAPTSVNSISAGNEEDFVSNGSDAATKCLQVINNVEKVLAIELISSARALALKGSSKVSSVLGNLVADFRQHLQVADKNRPLDEDIIKAIEFIRSYKF